jgi:hypothetical protein
MTFNLHESEFPPWVKWVEFALVPSRPGYFYIPHVVWFNDKASDGYIRYEPKITVKFEDLPEWARERTAVLMTAPTNFYSPKIGARTHLYIRPLLEVT